MTPYYQDGNVQLFLGDCRDILPGLTADAIICDPPYGLSREPDMAEVLRHWLAGDDYQHSGGGFMGRTWDSFVPGPSYWRAAFGALPPGGRLLAFGGTRTADLLGIALRLAGWEIRDTIQWLYGSGFPKSLDVSKAIDKAAGAKREVIGQKITGNAKQRTNGTGEFGRWAGENTSGQQLINVTTPATPEAARWQGWGTALKPAHEPIIVARRPLEGTVAANVLRYGTGAINVDGCRVEGQPRTTHANGHRSTGSGDGWRMKAYEAEVPAGRWPANVVLSHVLGPGGCQQVGTRKVQGSNNGIYRRAESEAAEDDGVILGKRGPRPQGFEVNRYADPDGTETVAAWKCVDGCPVAEIDRQSGDAPPSRRRAGRDYAKWKAIYSPLPDTPAGHEWGYQDSGGASRFFATFHDPAPFLYTAKASRAERGPGNDWPTVKPVALMRWLCRLVTPPGGLVIDPFMGSGTTLLAARAEGFRCVGIDSDEHACEIAAGRLTQAVLLL